MVAAFNSERTQGTVLCPEEKIKQRHRTVPCPFRNDIFHNPVFNTSFKGFVSKSVSKTSMVTAYGFAAFAWIQTTISIFSDDAEQRAEQRGYKLV